MKTDSTINHRLTTASTSDELRGLLAAGSLTAKERRQVESHLSIAEDLQHANREYIPVSLKQKLYALEEPDRTVIKDQVRSNAALIISLLLVTLFGIILFTANIRTDTVFFLQILFLCSLFGFVFYTLFKSKILHF
jgi:hypothetical protein